MVDITNPDLTLEDKLNLIDDSLLVDPQDLLMCEGCQ